MIDLLHHIKRNYILGRKTQLMEKDNYVVSNIVNYISAVKNGKAHKKGVCILIGAGADIASGGKTFTNLKYDLLKKNDIDIPSDASEEKITNEFDTLINKFTQSGRCTELENVMRDTFSPSEGYELLVLLAEMKYIDAVVTTNFDTLLEETEKELSMHPFDIYAPGVSIPDHFYMNRNHIRPIYLKMHGDLYGRYISHLTKKEIESKQYGTDFVKLLSYILSKYFIIVIGYGGYDDLITDLFTNIPADDVPVYWCNVKEQESPLVSLLKKQKRFNYVSISFDDFFKYVGLSFLGKQELPDTNPHFLPTVIQAKANNGKEIYTNSADYVLRNEIIEQINEFIIDMEKNTIMLYGKKGMGKSVFVGQMIEYYNDFLFIPVKINKVISESILKTVATTIGYKTDVPFSLLYNFAKWCNESQFNIIFVLDEICISDEQEDSIKYIKELLDFFNIIRQYNAIKFILCIDENAYEYINKTLDETSYLTFLLNIIHIGKFSNKEVDALLQKCDKKIHITDETYELLKNPYIWNLISKKNHVIDATLDNFIGDYIEELICNNKNLSVNKMTLQLYLEKCADAVLNHKNISRNKNLDTCLLKNQIIDSEGNFAYNQYAEYYYYKHLKRLYATAAPLNISNLGSLMDNSILRNAYSRVFSDIDSAESLRKNIDRISKFIAQLDTPISYVSIMVYDIFKRIQQQKYVHLKNYIFNANSEVKKFPLLFGIICYTSVYAPEDPYVLLNYMGDIKPEMQYDSFILKNTYIYHNLLLPLNSDTIQAYVNTYQNRFQKQNIENNFLDFLFLLTSWGADSMSEASYQEMIDSWKKIIQIQKKQLFSKEAFSYATQQINHYAYNILFNSGTDVDEKFANTINNDILRSIVFTVLKGEAIDLDEYMQLVSLATDINNAWIFLICNFITVESMKNDANLTKNIFKESIKLFEREDLVKKIDFYLSSVFMSLNIVCQSDNEFNLYFDTVVDLYERVLFETPSVRNATSQRFSDEFEQKFEDGFNPLAFYFYTAPSACYKESKPWNNGNEYLSQYWKLAHNLDCTGNYSEMLRIVHALGQMISIYPKEGFAALENLVDYPHEIIRKGILRILEENYLRYPTDTIEFINRTKLNISKEELLRIKANNESKWQNKTLEQLHWYRLFANLTNILQKDIVSVFLEKMFTSVSYASFMNDFFNELF